MGKGAHAFEALIDDRTFLAAQRAFRKYQSDEQMLLGWRRLLKREAWLNRVLVENCRDIPCSRMYQDCFGTLMNAYALIGYNRAKCSWQSCRAQEVGAEEAGGGSNRSFIPRHRFQGLTNQDNFSTIPHRARTR